MIIKEIPYPTDTRKFEVKHKGREYICYIPGPFNCIGASVYKDGNLIEDWRLALEIETACRSAARSARKKGAK